MADIVDKKTRSRIMSNIRGANTKPELLLRQALHGKGLRFRTNVRTLPGSPDIVFPRWNAAIQVHGCYWHRHADCAKNTTPSSNVKFWNEKFAANVKRDAKTLAELQRLGWRTAIVWECAIGKKRDADVIEEIAAFIRDKSVRHQEFR